MVRLALTCFGTGIGGSGMHRRSRAAATAAGAQPQILAIIPLVRPGVRLSSNSIRAVRLSLTRSSPRALPGAASRAASPARSLRQTRQNSPVRELSQLSGNSIGPPSMRLTDTAQRAHTHLRLAKTLMFRTFPAQPRPAPTNRAR